MADPRFYVRMGPFTLRELAAVTGSSLGAITHPELKIRDVVAVGSHAPGVLVYAQGAKNLESLIDQSGFAVIVKPEEAGRNLPGELLLNSNPQRGFALAASHFYPPDRQPVAGFSPDAIDPSAKIAETARIATGVVVGAMAEIGEGTIVGANSVIGPAVRIGRHCRIASNVTLTYAIVGDRVIIHPSAAIGQDGFGFFGSATGHLKMPQLGRVIIQDDVEIGACATIDRGALADTMIGEGTKIDNLVHIGHNCRIGRHVIIVGQVGVSGSSNLGDFVALGGQVGVADHITIGDHARVAARGAVFEDIPAGETWAGFPARPRMEWLREVAWLHRSVKNRSTVKRRTSDPADEEA